MILAQWSNRSGACLTTLLCRFSQRSNKNVRYVIPRSISLYFLPAIRCYSPTSNNKRSLGDGMYCGSSYRYLVSPRQVYYVNELPIISFTREKCKICLFCFSFMLTPTRKLTFAELDLIHSAFNLTEGQKPSFTHWYHTQVKP